MIRPVKPEDIPFITEIYNYYVRETAITFDIIELTKNTMKERVEKIAARYPYFVLEQEGEVLGYTYANEWKPKDAYKFTVESTVYLNPKATGKGYGALLYSKLIQELKRMSFRVVLGGITVPNEASIALHEKFGFKKVAVFENIGKKFGQLYSVGYWQLMLA